MSKELLGAVNEIFHQSVQPQTLPQHPQKSGESFESVLQDDKDKKQLSKPESTTAENLQSKLDQLQEELNRKINAISPAGTRTTEVLPQLLQPETRSDLLRQVSKEIGNESLGSNLQNNFMNVEKTWKEVEMIMQSKDRLSPGELLALQARLYQVSHQVEVMSKVVDQMAGGVKTILNTNV